MKVNIEQAQQNFLEREQRRLKAKSKMAVCYACKVRWPQGFPLKGEYSWHVYKVGKAKFVYTYGQVIENIDRNDGQFRAYLPKRHSWYEHKWAHILPISNGWSDYNAHYIIENGKIKVSWWFGSHSSL